MTSKEVWELYSRLKKHFRTTSYNFFTSKSKIKPLQGGSNDEVACSRLSSLPKEELFGKILANLLENPGIIPVHLLDTKAKDIWEFWEFRVQNKYWLCYKQLKDHFDKTQSLEIESIVHAYCSSRISPEILVALYNCGYPFTLDHSDPIVSSISKLVVKYDPFLAFDKNQVHSILKKIK